MKGVKILIFINLVIALSNCGIYRQKNFDKCCEHLRTEIILKVSMNKDYEIIRKSLVDSMNMWGDMGLRYFSKTIKVKISRIDSVVIFNNSKTKALLFSHGDDIDRVHMITGEKTNNGWFFIYTTQPTFTFSIDDYTENIVINKTLKLLAEDGLINGNTCKIEDTYINNKWFAEWRKESHSSYLQNKY